MTPPYIFQNPPHLGPQEGEDLRCLVLGALQDPVVPGRLDHQLGILRLLVGIVDACEALELAWQGKTKWVKEGICPEAATLHACASLLVNCIPSGWKVLNGLTSAGFLVEPLGITALTHLNGNLQVQMRVTCSPTSKHGPRTTLLLRQMLYLHVDLNELPGLQALADLLPVRPVGRYEAGESNHAGVGKELRDLPDAPAWGSAHGFFAKEICMGPQINMICHGQSTWITHYDNLHSRLLTARSDLRTTGVTPDVLCAICRRESKVMVQPMPDVVAVQVHRQSPLSSKSMLQSACDSAFSRTRQSCEPEDTTPLTQKVFFLT